MMLHIENPKDHQKKSRVLTDGQVVKNLPANVGDTDSVPDQRTKIPHATTIEAHVFCSLCATRRKSVYQNKSSALTLKIPLATTKT